MFTRDDYEEFKEEMVRQQQFLKMIQGFMTKLESEGYEVPTTLWGVAGSVAGTIHGIKLVLENSSE